MIEAIIFPLRPDYIILIHCRVRIPLPVFQMPLPGHRHHFLNIRSTACSLGQTPIVVGKYSHQSSQSHPEKIVFNAFRYSQYSEYQPHVSQSIIPVIVTRSDGTSSVPVKASDVCRHCPSTSLGLDEKGVTVTMMFRG